MFDFLKKLIASPEGMAFIRMLIAAALGSFAVSEWRDPQTTAGRWIFTPKEQATPTNIGDAIGRISFGNSGCTATITGPIAARDKQVWILTAAHCVSVGQQGRMKLKDGSEFAVVCVSRDARADCAWLRADRWAKKIPHALLADQVPEVGSNVWHQGYGIDNPGNVERGTLTGKSGNGAQLQYRLSVSPGDSGGGIIATSTGRILSPVCCTTRLAGLGDVWGSTPQAAASLKSRVGDIAHLGGDGPDPGPERIHPIRELPDVDWPRSK